MHIQFQRGRRGLTLIELVVVMGLILILGGVMYQSYQGQAANARTATLAQILGQFSTGLNTFAAMNQSGTYPGGYPEKGTPSSDTVNTDGAATTSAAGYTALLADLATVNVYGLPAASGSSLPSQFATWSYEPIDTTTPPTFTLTVTATTGNGHALCLDPTNGLVDLGSGGTPATPGVKCK